MSSEDKYYVINGTLYHADMIDELYHAGIKGMQWGKHLPGTDWWKKTVNSHMRGMNSQWVTKNGSTYATKRTFGNKVKANLLTARDAFKTYGGYIGNNTKVLGDAAKTGASNAYNAAKTGVTNAYNAAKTKGANAYSRVKTGTSKLWNDSKGYTQAKIEELREFARQAYTSSRSAVRSYFVSSFQSHLRSDSFSNKTPLSHLDNYQNKQMRDAMKVYTDGKTNGGFANTLNLWFQNAQYGIVKGCNTYLKKFGLDDEVDSFISKFKGESDFTKKNRRKAKKDGGGEYYL